VVNASGLEIAAAFAAWCAGLCVIEQTDVPRALVVWTSVAFVALILSRPLSPVNAAVILVVLALLAGRSRLRTVRRARGVRTIGIVIVASAVIAGLFLLVDGEPGLLGFPLKPPLSTGSALREILDLTPSRLQQGIGLFGWTDTPTPNWVLDLWTGLVAGLCTLGLVLSSRCRFALPPLLLSVLAMPFVFETPLINAVGPYWQGRYSLPLLVGVPLVASALQPRRPHRRARVVLPPRLGAVLRALGAISLCGVVIWAQTATFVGALHRYTTGLGRPAGTPTTWSPPGGTQVVIALLLLGNLMLGALLVWGVLAPRHRSARLDVRGPAGT